MAFKKNTLFFILFMVMSTVVVAQTSIWRDHNPYQEPLKEGDLIEVVIQEKFMVDIDSKWQSDNKIEFKLNPDKNLDFLKASEQNKTYTSDNNTIYDIDETIDLTVMAEVLKSEDDGRTFAIQSKKVITVDGKSSALVLTGKISAKNINNGKIASKKIANLDITIRAKNPFPKDREYKHPASNTVDASIQLTKEEKRKLIEKHFQEILQYFK